MGVTAMMMDVVSEESGHQVVPMAPNMCITPAAPSPLPMPYPITASSSQLDPGTEKTQLDARRDLLMTARTLIADTLDGAAFKGTLGPALADLQGKQPLW